MLFSTIIIPQEYFLCCRALICSAVCTKDIFVTIKENWQWMNILMGSWWGFYKIRQLIRFSRNDKILSTKARTLTIFTTENICRQQKCSGLPTPLWLIFFSFIKFSLKILPSLHHKLNSFLLNTCNKCSKGERKESKSAKVQLKHIFSSRAKRKEVWKSCGNWL